VVICVISFKFFTSCARNLVEVVCGFLRLLCFRFHEVNNSFAGVHFYEHLNNSVSISVIH
jgi:hypothetical protein